MLVGLCQCSVLHHSNTETKLVPGDFSPGTTLTFKNKTVMTKRKVKFTSQYTYEFKPEFGEQNSGGSQTIQDDHYTVQDLLNKYTQGIMPPVEKRGVYDDPSQSDNLDDIDFTRNPNFDLSDVTDFVENVNERIQNKSNKKTLSEESVSSAKNSEKKDDHREDEIEQKKGEKHDLGDATKELKK